MPAFAAFERSTGKEVDVTIEAFAHPAGRSVWFGKDLAKTKDWIFPLPRDTIDEVDHCVGRLRSSGKRLEDIGTSDFPFSTIAEEIEAFKQEIATGRGFVIVRGLPSERYSDDELGKIFWGFGAHFGLAMRQSF